MIGWIVTAIGLLGLWIFNIRQILRNEERYLKTNKLFVVLLPILCCFLQGVPESTKSYFATDATLENVFYTGVWEEPQPPAGSETAWAGDIPFSTGIAKYFTYNMNQGTEETPVEAPLYQGADLVLTGRVLVWNTQDSIHIKVATLPTYSFDLIHMYIGLVPPEKHSPGNLGYRYSSEPMEEYTIIINSVYSDWHNNPDKRNQTSVSSFSGNETLSIALHAEIRQQDESQLKKGPVQQEQQKESQPVAEDSIPDEQLQEDPSQGNELEESELREDESQEGDLEEGETEVSESQEGKPEVSESQEEESHEDASEVDQNQEEESKESGPEGQPEGSQPELEQSESEEQPDPVVSETSIDESEV